MKSKKSSKAYLRVVLKLTLDIAENYLTHRRFLSYVLEEAIVFQFS